MGQTNFELKSTIFRPCCPHHDYGRGREVLGGPEAGGADGDADELSRGDPAEVVRAQSLSHRPVLLVSHLHTHTKIKEGGFITG